MEPWRGESQDTATDEALVRSIQVMLKERRLADAREAMGQLMEYHYPWLMRLSLFETGDHELAEECVQQIMLELTKSINGFDFRSSLKTWLFTVGRRTARRLRGRQWHWRRLFEREDEAGVHCAREADSPGGDVQLDMSERSRVMFHAVRDLPEAQRQAVFLHYYEDLSVEQTARRMGCSPSSVKTHLSRARKKLRRKLEEQGDFRELLFE